LVYTLTVLVAVPVLLRRHPTAEGQFEYVTPPRSALWKLWLMQRACCVLPLCGTWASLLLTGFDGYANPLDPWATLMATVVWLVTAMLCNYRNRRTVHAWLLRLALTEEARGAATIAALVGRQGATHALQLAQFLFRVVVWESLEEGHLLSNRVHADLPPICTVAAPLGSCDAFLSHSWSDDGHAKWRALHSWAERFSSAYGRAPSLWLGENTRAASTTPSRPVARHSP